MKKATIISLLFSSLLTLGSCKKEKELIEVQTPGPEQNQKGATVAMGKPEDVKAEDPEGTFQMQGLPYKYNSLEPFIDAKTMETHYSKHHVGYCNKLNKAIKDTPLAEATLEEVQAKLDLKNYDIRNNAGGLYNHNFFFAGLAPNAGGEPTGTLQEQIITDFVSFDEFKTQFTDKATKLFGSGWVWLVKTKDGKLVITTTANQDNPLMKNAETKGTPILALDVWEHAYYLKYQNKRKDYIEAFYNIINWKKAQENFDK